MKGFSKIILACSAAIAITAFAGHGRGKPTGKPIIIQPNQQILKVSLDANATTGYSWFLKRYNRRYFTLSDYQYVAGNTDMPGAPGKAVFTFKVNPNFHKAPFATRMKLSYMRPWDTSSAMPRTLLILSIPSDKAAPAPKAITAKPPTHAKKAPNTMNSHQMNAEIEKLSNKMPVQPSTMLHQKMDLHIDKMSAQTHKMTQNQMNAQIESMAKTMPANTTNTKTDKDNWLSTN